MLDTFGGSGSTMMACEQTNRICCMMELDEKYASVILRRYVEDTGDSENVYVERGREKIAYSRACEGGGGGWISRNTAWWRCPAARIRLPCSLG